MGGRILLVDDEVELSKLVKMRLEANGYEVLTAFNGQDALEKAQTERVDVIILDLMLPKINGYEVYTMLKQDARYQHIPIVIFTALAQTKDAALAKECGANAYICKPFKADQLLQTIASFSSSSPTEPSGGGANT